METKEGSSPFHTVKILDTKLISMLFIGNISAQNAGYQHPKALSNLDIWIPEWSVYIFLVLFILGYIYFHYNSK